MARGEREFTLPLSRTLTSSFLLIIRKKTEDEKGDDE